MDPNSRGRKKAGGSPKFSSKKGKGKGMGKRSKGNELAKGKGKS
jgi:hypothetical protein